MNASDYLSLLRSVTLLGTSPTIHYNLGCTGRRSSSTELYLPTLEETSCPKTKSRNSISYTYTVPVNLNDEGVLTSCVYERQYFSAACRTNVTMLINVDHKQHSHFIGIHGEKVKKMMKMTGCKIQFPCNRTSGQKKSNVVTLIGSICNVEQARSYIRMNMQLIMSFPVQYLTVNQTNELLLTKRFVDIQKVFNVKVAFYCNTVNKKTFCRIYSVEMNKENVIKASDLLLKIFSLVSDGTTFQMKLFLPICDQRYVFVKHHSSPRTVEHHTNTRISIDYNNNTKPEISVDSPIVIEGSVVDVLKARKLIKAILPIELKFEIPAEKYLDDKISKIKFPYCAITIKRINKKNCYLVTLKCCEYFVDKLYEAFKIFLDVERPVTVFNYRDDEVVTDYFEEVLKPHIQAPKRSLDQEACDKTLSVHDYNFCSSLFNREEYDLNHL